MIRSIGDVELPTIHLNGSHGPTLADEITQATQHLRTAINALATCAPHMRDYYPNPDKHSYDRARAQHEDRLRRLIEVQDDLTFLRIGIQKRVDERERGKAS